MSHPTPEPLAPRFATILAELRAASAPERPQRASDAMLLASLLLILEALLSLITAWEAGQPLPAIPRRLTRRPRTPRAPGARPRAHHQPGSSARTPLRAPHPHVHTPSLPRAQTPPARRAPTPPATAPPRRHARQPPPPA
jgi:hypothetical protein